MAQWIAKETAGGERAAASDRMGGVNASHLTCLGNVHLYLMVVESVPSSIEPELSEVIRTGGDGIKVLSIKI
jgi:hypothetical protein